MKKFLAACAVLVCVVACGTDVFARDVTACAYLDGYGSASTGRLISYEGFKLYTKCSKGKVIGKIWIKGTESSSGYACLKSSKVKKGEDDTVNCSPAYESYGYGEIKNNNGIFTSSGRVDFTAFGYDY